MNSRTFFKSAGTITVAEIAALTGAKPRANASLDRAVGGIAPLDVAGSADLAFCDNAKFASALDSTRAGACLVAARYETRVPSAVAALVSDKPYRAFVAVAQKLFPSSLRPSSLFEAKGVAPNTSIHPTARVESGVTVDPGAVIGPRAAVGAGTVIGAGAVIGPDVQIGRDCAIGPNATVVHTLIGDRVILHAGCRIGQDGFGYTTGARGHGKVPQIGRVIIQDDVEIGAGTTIDRGGIRDTIVGEGSKIDNLAQIAHNVVIGRHCVIAAQAGISGSVTLGDFVVLGGNVGIIDHVTVGEGAQLAARTSVVRDIPPGGQWAGHAGAKPIHDYLREVTFINRLVHTKKTHGHSPSDAPSDHDGKS